MKTKNLLAASIGLAALLTSCQAKDDDPQQPPVASFTYTGTAQNFTPIVFSSTAPGATAYAWDFGDATTDTQPNPSHTFRRAGSYTVVLRATGAAGTATTRQTLTLSQADTAAVIGQQLTGNYRFNRVYRVNYNTYTNSPLVYTRLRDTTLTLTATSGRYISLYDRGWTLMGGGVWNRTGAARPTYSYVQGIGSLYTEAVFLQNGDSVSFTVKTIGGNGPGPKEYLSFYGGKIH